MLKSWKRPLVWGAVLIVFAILAGYLSISEKFKGTQLGDILGYAFLTLTAIGALCIGSCVYRHDKDITRS